ncbi:MAG: glycosyltransferase [Lentimicrobiaceae bacterium]|nr:glycosyltransferase [Lentimicrobiaceae bacterium]
MKIVLLNTAHNSFDDRVFYHQAKTLSEAGHQVTIVSTVETMQTIHEDINICAHHFNVFSRKEKQQKITALLHTLAPDMVICDTPAAVWAAHKYHKKHKTKIVYDVTEWYPSRIHLQNNKGLQKWLRCIMLLLFNLYAGALATGFIFGEYYKSKVFRLLYFWKPFLYLPYFPDLKYIEPLPVQNIQQTIRLFYGGSLSPKRGIPQVIQSVVKAAQRKPETIFQLHLICNISTEKDKHYFDVLTSNMPPNVEIIQKQWLPFSDFCKYASQMDLCFDLRAISWEHNRSLPIKLFYYLACGRPIIYAKLKSITTFFSDISFGYLVNPSDTDAIADKIVNYINHPEIYREHCQNALHLSKEKYNWAKIKDNLIQFIAVSFN